MTNKIQSNEDQIEIRTNKFKYVVVHIDLKGAPPKLSFLKSMLQEVKMLGANALLMEYEDMFPYVNELKNLSKSEHYDINDLLVFLTEAKTIGVEIIPLIQTFGHMESVLKLQEFKHLREESSALDSICPSKLGTEILIGAMLRQVIEFHQIIAPLKHIHVGCDEVWTINKCDECKKREFQTHELFFRHLDTVVNLVTNASPNTTVLFWDDMMRRLSPTQLEELKMKSNKWGDYIKSFTKALICKTLKV
ncbi:hypothetical protein NE865_02363 [Phthorimaea operculella]|nr:hypothetical protein NE865_02363 [Phthorimaea operculella]